MPLAGSLSSLDNFPDGPRPTLAEVIQCPTEIHLL